MGNLNVALVLAVSITVFRFADGIKHDFTSTVQAVGSGFTTAIASYDVRTPDDSWIEIQLRARVGDRWTNWYAMGQWSRDRAAAHRHSVNAPADADGKVETDTLVLGSVANAWQVRVFLHFAPNGSAPSLSLVAVTTGTGAPVAVPRESRATAWGIDLDVPQRTQRMRESPDALAGGGDAWCSPTSVSMIMAYWAARLHHPQWNVDVPAAAEGTYDPVYEGCGNWPFNVAFASEHGLAGWVERLTGLADVEHYIERDIPLVASIRVAPGELDGSPYGKTDGHLLVVRGFTRDGDVIANDPYALPGHIRIVYKRVQFERVWMQGSGGIVYVIAPPEVLRQIQTSE